MTTNRRSIIKAGLGAVALASAAGAGGKESHGGAPGYRRIATE